ncbi:ABC transporter permease [Desulfonema ishimotonii]|uniref:ABC transporter permease n=1 Tax=Desulfonema ishimotonii TaxID=45657 RepID=A0A401FSW9_9BACT|nr:lipid A export permease/ATP-binding protein MsbA [Desulfonema ishimotonii]GBC60067.1 ABC transporter permease [Desulfonema ishimotonii]
MEKNRIKTRHKRLLSMVRENWLRLLAAMGCMAVIAVTTSATAFMVKPVLDDIFFNKDQKMLMVIPVAVIFIYFLRGIGTYGQEYLMNYVGQGIIRQLRNMLYDRIQDLPLSFFQAEKTGVLMSRITNDVSIIKQMVSSSVTSVLRDVFTIIGLTGVIFYRDWKMAVFAFVILPVAFYPIVELGRRVRKVSTGCQEAMAEMSSFLHETFAGNKIVKAFGREAYEKERFARKTRSLFRLEMKAVMVDALSSPVMEFLAGMGIAFIIWYGGSKVVDGSSTAGTFFSFMAAVLMLYDPVKKISKVNNKIQQGLAATDRVFDIIERESDITEADDPVEIPDTAHRVRFEQVSLTYDNRAEALKEISLSVGAGEVLALVGMSGGGKTSLVNLIPRFYDVTQGRILIDGTDIREASLASLRRQIAIVTQDTILFDDTVRNNIAYGKPDATDAEIEAAAKAAYAYDFIQRFPEQFDTRIGELGNRLSGGQKQRICIARALLKDAPVLILDEATSALDTESEMLVQKALENLMRGRTTFVIAHRLSTISYAHRVAVVVDGRIVEEGTHEALMARRGEYFKLHRMQFKTADEIHLSAVNE